MLGIAAESAVAIRAGDKETGVRKAVICISRSIGAGGETIGRVVARQLGYRYMDEEIVRVAAEKANVDPRVVADSEDRTSLIHRLIDAMFTLPGADDVASSAQLDDAPTADVSAATPDAVTREDLRALIRETIRETARHGDVVMVAHAASFAVGARPDVLRVFVTATPKVRAQRLVQLLPADEMELSVAKSDEQRARYLRTFYDVREELPTHYDVVINTDTLSEADAAAIIVAVAGA